MSTVNLFIKRAQECAPLSLSTKVGPLKHSNDERAALHLINRGLTWALDADTQEHTDTEHSELIALPAVKQETLVLDVYYRLRREYENPRHAHACCCTDKPGGLPYPSMRGEWVQQYTGDRDARAIRLLMVEQVRMAVWVLGTNLESNRGRVPVSSVGRDIANALALRCLLLTEADACNLVEQEISALRLHMTNGAR